MCCKKWYIVLVMYLHDLKYVFFSYKFCKLVIREKKFIILHRHFQISYSMMLLVLWSLYPGHLWCPKRWPLLLHLLLGCCVLLSKSKSLMGLLQSVDLIYANICVFIAYDFAWHIYLLIHIWYMDKCRIKLTQLKFKLP